MTLFRPQRGSYAESMLEAIGVTKLRDIAEIVGVTDLAHISTRYYTFDTRNDWDTYVVLVDGQAVGFTNGAL